MTRRADRTPTFWTSEPVGMLPRGQGDLPFGAAVAELPAPASRPTCGDRAFGIMLPCVRTPGHGGGHFDGIGGWWGCRDDRCPVCDEPEPRGFLHDHCRGIAATLSRDPATFLRCARCDAQRSDVRDRGAEEGAHVVRPVGLLCDVCWTRAVRAALGSPDTRTGEDDADATRGTDR